jgi:iron complex outermembrane receptor protein
MHWGLFAQDEIKLADPLMLIAGLRHDRYEGFGSELSPRLALIYTPTGTTTFKALAGRAFRAPNEYELHFENNAYRANPKLRPDDIQTLELIAEHFIGGGVQVSASAFRNELTDLASQVIDPIDSLFVFRNSGAITSSGLELGLGVNRGYGVSGEVSYSLQRTEDRATGIRLTNSPGQMVQLQLRSPILGSPVIAALDAEYMSARLTLAGKSAGSHTVTNFSLLAPRTFDRFDLSATFYNVFNARYADPVPDGFIQDVIPQDGRSMRVRATLHY